MTATAAPAAPVAPSGRSLVVLGGLLRGGAALLRRLLLEQGLTIGYRDLVVVGMNFSKGQEAVSVATVIHEGRLQRRLYARDLGEINIAPKLLLTR